ncbi:MAG: hypothetical protein ABI813_06910 [Bacteroidota bacterium]
MDAALHFTTKKDFVYAAMAIKDGDHWILYAVYPDTTVLLKVYFKDAALTIKDGPFTLYHPKRIVAQQGYFKDNIPNGHWKSWYAGGELKNEGEIVNNNLSGVWKAWYQNGNHMSERTYLYSDSMVGQPVHQHSPAYQVEKVLDDFPPEGKLEGPATSWYENGQMESAVNYHHDSLSGTCTWFWANGHPSSKETYTDGKVTALECYDEQGKYTGPVCSLLKPPVLIDPIFTATDYIVDELHKEKNRDIREEGEATVSFTVTAMGKVKDLVVVRSPDPALTRHIVQIFASMPPWSPAVMHNRVMDFPVQLVIPYYRN